jgi:DNA repair photolyase
VKKTVVDVPAIKQPLRPSPGFAKKELATYKLDLLGSCEFGCVYCSSDMGNYLRINRRPFLRLAEAQLGRPVPVDEMKSISFHWPDVIPNLERQLETKEPTFGLGETVVFSMLTDGFSPRLVASGKTEQALRLLVEKTSLRIRVLTKNAIVGSARWIEFFKQFPGRFVVGLSAGTLAEGWARTVEVGTSSPEARVRALQALQDAGVPTYGMLCPCFPDVLENASIERLVAACRPALAEHVWAEPFNDRQNWTEVRAGYACGSPAYDWFTDVFERGNRGRWSAYAVDLYLRIKAIAVRDGWIEKLRYLLYEGLITKEDAPRLGDGRGILLQGTPGPGGRSQNPHVAAQFDACAA